MLEEGQAQDHVEEVDDGSMDEDLANDNSMEAKIEREVKKAVKSCEKDLETKMESFQVINVELVEKLNKISEKQMHLRADQTQGYIQEVHNFQIVEMNNFKQCHTQYLNSAAQFDKKLQSVIGIETSNIQILKQLKIVNEIISELSAANIAAFSDNNLLSNDSLPPDQSGRPDIVTSKKGVPSVNIQDIED